MSISYRSKVIAVLVTAVAAAVVAAMVTSPAQAGPEIRAFWADSWHGGFKSAGQVDALVNTVKAANCNAVFVQARRRGQVYYNSSIDPRWTDVSPVGFDALAYLIDKCHNSTPRIEVHVWSDGLLAWGASSWPSNSGHIMNEHPEYLTQDSGGNTFDGSNYSLDPGHPGASDYLNDVAMEVIANYDIDGFQWDYIRFAGTNWGYNPTSVARFNARYGRTGTPVASDDTWSQWRRDQVTNIVRRVYANAIAIKPNIKISASTITWGGGPSSDSGWPSTSAYSKVFQDWRSWMQEGILDINVPMCYFDQDEYPSYWSSWINYAKNKRYNRFVAIGQGSGSNDIADIISQVRSTRTNGTAGYPADGVAFYSYAASNAEGYSVDTLANALTHVTGFDPNPTPVFSTAVATPTMTWKTSPTLGHLKGTVTNSSNGSKVDGALVSITGPASRTQYTDCAGFYAFIDLPAGNYSITVTKQGFADQTVSQLVSVGTVANRNISLSPGGCPYASISGVLAQGVTATNATITWTTDVVANSQVEYGTTASYGSSSALDGTLVTNHAVQLAGLTPNTTYHYRVRSVPSGGCASYSGDATFKTGGGATIDDIIIESHTSGGAVNTSGYVEAGAWGTSSAKASFAGSGLTGSGSQYATSYGAKAAYFVPNIAVAGPYEVFVAWGTSTNGAETNFKIISGGATVVSKNIDQYSGAGNANKWNSVGTAELAAGFSQSNASLMIDGSATNNPRGIVSPRLMSDAVKFVFRGTIGDTVPPTIPTSTAAVTTSTDEVRVTWQASTDDTAVTGYNIYRNDVLIGDTADLVYFDTQLSPNTPYSYKVAAIDAAGNQSALSTVASTVTLSVPPSSISITCPRDTDIWYTTNGFQFTSQGGFGVGTVSKYRVAWDTSPTHAWGQAGEHDWGGGSISKNAATHTGYYLHLKGYNSAGVENGVADFGPYKYDPTAPTTPVVNDDGTFTSSLISLNATWTSTDTGSGIKSYQYQITDDLSAVVRDWTDAGSATSVEATGLSLALGRTYKFSVKATNNANLTSAAGISNGIKTANAVSTIGELKQLADGTEFAIPGDKKVLAAFGSETYVGEQDRSSGICVQTTGAAEGSLVKLGGVLTTLATGERAVTQAGLAVQPGGSVLAPVRMTTRQIGGEAFGLHTPAVGYTVGLANTGLLVGIWGKVTAVGTGFFYVDDGAGLDDGSGNVGLRVIASGSTPTLDSVVAVTGVSSAWKPNGSIQPALKMLASGGWVAL